MARNNHREGFLASHSGMLIRYFEDYLRFRSKETTKTKPALRKQSRFFCLD